MMLSTSIRRLMLVVFCLTSYFYAAVIFADTSTLLNYTYLGVFSKETAKLALQKMPPLDTLEPKYSLNLYKIQYKTPAPDGHLAMATGLVAMPISPLKPVAIVSYHHGTRVTRHDVPSDNVAVNDVYPALYGSSGGYMVVMPDYHGHGDSELMLHPYVQADTLATTSVDMLLAAKELAHQLDYPVSEKLFLAGYSEGGFTTTVTYEALLKDHKDIPVTAVVAGSAPYDFTETMHFIVDQPGPRASLYLAYFFYSMQTYQHYWSGLEEIFQKPYDTLVPVLLDGYHMTPDIIQALPASPRDMLKPAFLAGIINGSDKNTDKLRQNMNHYDFKPTSPFLLVGTKGDHDVPYHGAEIAYEHFKRHSDQVSIKSVSDKLDHVEAFPFVLKESLAFFKQYDQ